MLKKQHKQQPSYQSLEKALTHLNQIFINYIKTNTLQHTNNHPSENEDQFWKDFDKENSDSNLTEISINESIFAQIPNLDNIQLLEKKTAESKSNYITNKRKDQLFKRLRKDQQNKIITRKKELEQRYKFDINLNNNTKCADITVISKDQQIKIAITSEDLSKLQPQVDLNDTIVEGYLKIIKYQLLDSLTAEQTFIFSPYFMQKLLDDYIKDDCPIYNERENQILLMVKKKTQENYQKIKKWTKKVDILTLKYLVIPINAYKHWNCIIVLNPKYIGDANNKPCILYCDSMFEKRTMFVEALRIYLQCELKEKKELLIQINENSMPSYQLLLPRQTNLHDCGLYLLTYVEFLLGREQDLSTISMDKIQNRKFLKLFPRSYIVAMRQRLRKLFISLMSQPTKYGKIMSDYKKETLKIIQESQNQKEDYDSIDTREFKKYLHLAEAQSGQFNGKDEYQYQSLVRFYLDQEVNFYEK